MRASCRPTPRATERGLTLIEVMVSLLLASLVIAGGYTVLFTQQRVSRQQTQIQASQQGLWVAMEMIQRDVRKAGMGFGFCRHRELNGFVNRSVFEAWRRVNGAATRYYALTVVDGAATGDPAQTDHLYVTWGSPRSDGAADARLADQPTAIWAAPSPYSVVLFPNVVGENQEEAFLYPAGCDCGGAGSACSQPDGTAAKPFPLVLLFDPAVPAASPPIECSVLQVTAVGGAGAGGNGCTTGAASPELITSLQPTAPWNRTAGGSGGVTYNRTMRVSNLGDLTRVHWYVQSTAAAGLCPRPPCLVRATIAADTDVETAQVVATGIEDLQIVPACDTLGTGIRPEGANDGERRVDDWFNNVAGETVTIASTGCLTYPQVRLSLVSRTGAEDPSFVAQPRPALENHAPASTSDRFRRRILSAVVAPPNLGI